MKIKVLIRQVPQWNRLGSIVIDRLYLQFPGYFVRLIDNKGEYGVLDPEGTLIEYED